MGIALLGGFLIYVMYFLPLPQEIILQKARQNTKIYDRNGVLLYEILQPDEGKKNFLPFEKIPETFIQATLAAEDNNYYSHFGIDVWAVLRAVWLNAKNQEIVSGGSTITQQVVRNLLGTDRERTWQNKLIESLYAIRLNQISGKEQILERYLNTVYYGNLTYGAEAASLGYFGKHLYDLDTAEMSLLAGIPQNPSRYNPLTNLEESQKRQKEVVERMVKNNWLDATTAQTALEEGVKLSRVRTTKKAPHFIDYLLDELEKKLGKEKLFYGGLTITTTLDVYLNDEVERIIRRNLERVADKKAGNGAVLVINQQGEIVTMVGSKDFYDDSIDGQVNVTLRLRQPGSTLKPITYAAALQKGWTNATTITDLPVKFMTEEGTPYTPKNFDQQFHGLVTVRDALANSYNIPAVKALQYAGTGAVLRLAREMGMSSLDKDGDFYGLALTLGDGEVRLFDLVTAFSVFANAGKKIASKNILKIIDENGKTIDLADAETDEKTVLSPQLSYLITSILSDNGARVPSFGADSALNIPNIAAKTGTSRNFRDNWVVGYSPRFTAGVWVGNNDGSSMINISGVEGAGPIFHDTVMELVKLYGNPAFEKPDGLVNKEICLPSGKLPASFCPERRTEVFLRGKEPTETDDLWQMQQGQLTLSLPPELIPWAKKKGYPVDTAAVSKKYLKIENPQHLDEFRINPEVPLQYQKVSLRAFHSGDIKQVEWFVNGTLIGTGDEVAWELRTGNFEIEARGGGQSDQVSIIVSD